MKGCTYITGYSGTGDGHRPVFCNKIPAFKMPMCPKHIHITAEEQQKPKAAALKGVATRNWKREKEAALAASPLRAENPAFAKSKVRLDA